MKARSKYRPTDESRRPGPVSEPIVGNQPAVDAAHVVKGRFDQLHGESFPDGAVATGPAKWNVQVVPKNMDTAPGTPFLLGYPEGGAA